MARTLSGAAAANRTGCSLRVQLFGLAPQLADCLATTPVREAGRAVKAGKATRRRPLQPFIDKNPTTLSPTKAGD